MDEAFLHGLYGCGAVALLCWLLGVLTREHSWVDRLWSITPFAYVGFFAWRGGFADARVNLMFALSLAWGQRLTYNFARKGGYAKGGEDYRWLVLKAKLTPWQWQLFGFFFVAGYQNFLLYLIALPAWLALRGAQPLGPIDAVAAVGFSAALILEAVADQQQWRFQESKRAAREAKRPHANFLTSGLFRYSRHPNFFAEQALWWCFYLFSVAATGEWLNVTIVGPTLLTLLFHGSTNFTESITLSKYPEYAEYQGRVSRLIPWPSPEPAVAASAATTGER
jgi:steroid 5-alpha reductase family enzyme